MRPVVNADFTPPASNYDGSALTLIARKMSEGRLASMKQRLYHEKRSFCPRSKVVVEHDYNLTAIIKVFCKFSVENCTRLQREGIKFILPNK